MKFLICLLTCFSASAFAQDENPQTTAGAAPSAPCSSAEHRAFDFWVGNWEVTAHEQAAGTNHIELVHNGCVLAEHWVSAAGNFTGSSLNIYDQANQQWHQTWVDTSGTLLQLDGGFSDGSMVMSGKRPGSNGGEVIHRISWTPNDDGSVRQHWQTSNDGSSWTTLFDGHYVRVTESR